MESALLFGAKLLEGCNGEVEGIVAASFTTIDDGDIDGVALVGSPNFLPTNTAVAVKKEPSVGGL